MPLHTNWFLSEPNVEGLKKFIEWSQEKEDVFYVTVTELLLWMTDDPRPSTAREFDPAALFPESTRERTCNSPNTCEMSHTNREGISDLRYMRTCEDCPEKYPWISIPELEDNN